MKRIKVSLNFKSPLLIGGRKSSNNFITTEEVIKGSVIRAAFAKVILKNCPVKNIKKDKHTKNWVFFRNEECCNSCEFKKICNDFDNIKFSYFYPKGSEIIPLSSMICKTYEEHGFIDCLVDLNECNKCSEGGRVEFATGLRTIGDNKVPFKDLEKSISVKTSINPYSKTSADGMLYSIETITSTGMGDAGKKECIFEGSIQGIEKEDLSLFKRLRVGGDTTVGLGKCEVSFIQDEKSSKLDMQKFSESYKAKFNIKDKEFVAIKFTGDLKIDFEEAKKSLNINDDYITTDDYKLIWKEALGLRDKNINISKIYTNFTNYRGYDTSKGNNVRTEIFTLAVRGTVIVFEGNSVHEIEECLDKHKSFGLDTKNGFGNYVLYDGR